MSTLRSELARMECATRSVSTLIALIWREISGSTRCAWSVRRSLIWAWTSAPRSIRWWFGGSVSWAGGHTPDRLVSVNVHIVPIRLVSISSLYVIKLCAHGLPC